MDKDRPWYHHLRLLPGGDTSIGAAITVSLTLYVAFFIFGLVSAAILRDVLRLRSSLGFLEVFSVANALPCFVISAWTGLRVRATRPIGIDEAAVHLGKRKVYFGDEVARVPREAVSFSTRPRQVSARMADGRSITAFFRVNGDPDDLMALARELRDHPGLTVEDWVHGRFERLAAELLPDPDGIREALAAELLPHGVVVTRVEAA